jgi:hypothetical protein
MKQRHNNHFAFPETRQHKIPHVSSDVYASGKPFENQQDSQKAQRLQRIEPDDDDVHGK